VTNAKHSIDAENLGEHEEELESNLLPDDIVQSLVSAENKIKRKRLLPPPPPSLPADDGPPKKKGSSKNSVKLVVLSDVGKAKSYVSKERHESRLSSGKRTSINRLFSKRKAGAVFQVNKKQPKQKMVKRKPNTKISEAD